MEILTITFSDHSSHHILWETEDWAKWNICKASKHKNGRYFYVCDCMENDLIRQCHLMNYPYGSFSDHIFRSPFPFTYCERMRIEWSEICVKPIHLKTHYVSMYMIVRRIIYTHWIFPITFSHHIFPSRFPSHFPITLWETEDWLKWNRCKAKNPKNKLYFPIYDCMENNIFGHCHLMKYPKWRAPITFSNHFPSPFPITYYDRLRI